MRSPILTSKRARVLRRNLTRPETTLWALLRRKQLSHLRFRRQHPFGAYILDFYCPAAKLCVEVDGPVHDDPRQVAHDAARTQWLAAQGISLVRFSAADVEERPAFVLATIARVAAPSTAFGGPPPPLRG
jgi:very-short-patch-repair endonuclease